VKVFADFGQHRIIHGSCLELLDNTKDNSTTVVVADWQFKGHKELIPAVIKGAVRVLEHGGTFISVLYPDLNYYVRKEAESAGLIFAEEILLQTKVTYVMNINTLPNRTIGIMSLVKGDLSSRKWQPPFTKLPGRILDADSESHYTPTNSWNEKQFKNGFKRGIQKHSEAMPKWVVAKMFKTIIPKNGHILDLFGGAGTIFANAFNSGISCDVSEIEENNCKIIHNRLIEY